MATKRSDIHLLLNFQHGTLLIDFTWISTICYMTKTGLVWMLNECMMNVWSALYLMLLGFLFVCLCFLCFFFFFFLLCLVHVWVTCRIVIWYHKLHSQIMKLCNRGFKQAIWYSWFFKSCSGWTTCVLFYRYLSHLSKTAGNVCDLIILSSSF